MMRILSKHPVIDFSLNRRCTEASCKAINAAPVAVIMSQHHNTESGRYHCIMIPVMRGGSNLRKGDSFHAGMMDKGIKESYSV